MFVSTILTVLGIAFFAQWSLLSNITSSILIFFNHPVKLGDYVKVLHKDYHFEGEVTEMNYFFVHVKTKSNETITIPNAHFFDKSFLVSEKKQKHKLFIQEKKLSSFNIVDTGLNTMTGGRVKRLKKHEPNPQRFNPACSAYGPLGGRCTGWHLRHSIWW